MTHTRQTLHDLPMWESAFAHRVVSYGGNLIGAHTVQDYRAPGYAYPFFITTSESAIYILIDPRSGGMTIGPDGYSFGTVHGPAFVPTMGCSGTLAAGWTTSRGQLSTALLKAVKANQLANWGDWTGCPIRIVGNSAGSSGKTEERRIIANTAGTTPTIVLGDTAGNVSPLSFTPAAGDRYELLSGSVFVPFYANAVGYTDMMTGFGGPLNFASYTAYPAAQYTIVLDEQYVPVGRLPGEGFFGNLTASATGATSITGTLGAADSSLLTNEYRNFQVRIVRDVAQPQAAGQRVKITAHTNGNPNVYTTSAWPVAQPSAGATYVVELIGDAVVVNDSGGVSLYTWTKAVGGFRADATWSRAGLPGGASLVLPNQPAAIPYNTGGGAMVHSFGLRTVDYARAARRSHIYLNRGNGSMTWDCLDIAAETWTQDVMTPVGMSPVACSEGTCGVYDPHSADGQYYYLNASAGSTMVQFDLSKRTYSPALPMLTQSQGTASRGQKMCAAWTTTAGVVHPYIYKFIPDGNVFRCMVR